MQEYSQADLKRLFQLPQGVIRSLSAAGFIAKEAPSGKTSYSFQDLLVLRLARALKAAKIASPKIPAALREIRAALPPNHLLTSMALAASGKGVAVRAGSLEWEVGSGQYALPLAASAGSKAVSPLPSVHKRSSAALAQAHYARGHTLEQTDLNAARAAYLAALDAHEDHLEARINLGRLLHLDGDLKSAEKVYRQAKSSSALLSYNLAILLEDLSREEEAISAYRDALAQDPHLHDAHFNLSRLFESAKLPREALKHLLAYRRHIERYGES